jgi:hypothetical protein
MLSNQDGLRMLTIRSSCRSYPNLDGMQYLRDLVQQSVYLHVSDVENKSDFPPFPAPEYMFSSLHFPFPVFLTTFHLAFAVSSEALQQTRWRNVC